MNTTNIKVLVVLMITMLTRTSESSDVEPGVNCDDKTKAFAVACETFKKERSLWGEQLTAYCAPGNEELLGELERTITLVSHKRLDEITQTLIEKAFEINSDFVDVQNRTVGLLKWVEWPLDWGYPDVVTDGTRIGVEDDQRLDESIRHSSEDLVSVIFQHTSWSDGELYVMQNSFWHADKTRPRVRPSVFVVSVEANHIRLTNLMPEFYMQFHAFSVSPYPFILGTASDAAGAPWVFLVEGPRGSARFIDLYGFCFDERTQSWVRRVGDSDGIASHINSYAYDHNTYTLALDTDFDEHGMDGASPIDLRAMIKEATESKH